MDVQSLAGVLRGALPELLVALDFDGTLAPLQPDPDDSRAEPGTVEVLTSLAERGAQVAVITGRDAQTVLRLGGFDAVPGVIVTGLYGLETWRDGRLDTPDTPAPLRTLQWRLPAVLRDAGADPAVWIEDKRLSLVVHGRRAVDWGAALEPLRAPVGELAASLGLELHPGNGVLEIRLPGYDKAGALRRLVDARPYRGVLFAGDDLGDLPALAEARRLRAGGLAAYGLAVEASGVPEVAAIADLALPTAAALVELLRAI